MATCARLVKADALGEQMVSGKEKLDWRRLSSEVEAVGASVEREISRRVLQRLDERGRTLTVDGKTYREVRSLRRDVLREGGAGDAAAHGVPGRLGEERQDGGRHLAVDRPASLRFSKTSSGRWKRDRFAQGTRTMVPLAPFAQ